MCGGEVDGDENQEMYLGEGGFELVKKDVEDLIR